VIPHFCLTINVSPSIRLAYYHNFLCFTSLLNFFFENEVSSVKVEKRKTPEMVWEGFSASTKPPGEA